MMRVGWLADSPGYVGGAEMTEAEFRAAAPEGVEIVDCPAGAVVPGLDRYVIHNCVHYTAADLEPIGKASRFRYLHDTWPAGDPALRRELLDTATLIFCSPLQQDFYGRAGARIPPAIDLGRFRSGANGRPRQGNVCIGRFAYGKGQVQLAEWAAANGRVDVYGDAYPSGPWAVAMGAVPYHEVPATLRRYERFVFLPTSLEPFGRAVVEAWAAGCELVVNENVGALHWIREEPEALKTAGEDFWSVITDG